MEKELAASLAGRRFTVLNLNNNKKMDNLDGEQLQNVIHAICSNANKISFDIQNNVGNIITPCFVFDESWTIKQFDWQKANQIFHSFSQGQKLAAAIKKINPAEESLPESALDVQIGGSHYKKMKIQVVEFVHANNLDAFQKDIIKYTCRHKDKNGVEDLKKALHYIQIYAKLEYGVDL